MRDLSHYYFSNDPRAKILMWKCCLVHQKFAKKQLLLDSKSMPLIVIIIVQWIIKSRGEPGSTLNLSAIKFWRIVIKNQKPWWVRWVLCGMADFCETLISISKLRLSRRTVISFSISTLNFSLRTLILILNSQKFSNSHSRISTINSRISEKSQPISYCGRKKCLQSQVLFCLISQKTAAAYIDLINQIGCQRVCLFSLIINPGSTSLLFVW